MTMIDRTIGLLPVAALAAFVGGQALPARAQDVLAVAPEAYRKLVENPRIRVLHLDLKPGGKVGLHAHPEHLLYLLTDATLAIAQQGKTPYEMTFKAGEALILPAQIQSTENTGDKSVRALVVEIKSAVTPPAPARKGRIRKPRRG